MNKDSIFEIGVTESKWSGITLKVYDRERTICDCFKRRSQMDSEMFAKAVNAYAADDRKNLANLSAYAKKLRVYKQVTNLMEVLLNGYLPKGRRPILRWGVLTHKETGGG